MHTTSTRFPITVSRLMPALGLEPDIRLDFSRASIEFIIAALYCLIQRGCMNALTLHAYLRDRGCRFDLDLIESLLTAYEGIDPHLHLWEQDKFGDYMPIMEDMPVGEPEQELCDELAW